MLTLSTDICFVKGVGEKRSKLYGKLGVYTVGDLLGHLPRDYIDLTAPTTTDNVLPGDTAVIAGVVVEKHEPKKSYARNLTLSRATVSDGVRYFTLLFFGNVYAFSALEVGERYLFHGRIQGSFFEYEMQSPTVFSPQSAGTLIPVYPSTAGLTSRSIEKDVKKVLDLADEQTDIVPHSISEPLGLMRHGEAVTTIHAPKSYADIDKARRTLAFEELFVLSCAFSVWRSRKGESPAPIIKGVPLAPMLERLPFELTNGQKQAIRDIYADLKSGTAMSRLVMGDVGSGKTLVAASAVYAVVKSGRQAAVMAPTELLANQHYNSFKALLEPLDITVEFLSGALPAKEKKRVRDGLKKGEVDLVVGTHALITADTVMDRLSLVVTDEQHRFGVNQRGALQRKGEGVHALILTATPIPRTLSLCIYGDLDVSVIRELPKGREPIATYVIGGDKRKRALGFILREIENGGQAYIVCPAIEENEFGLISAEEYYKSLEDTPIASVSRALIHGRVKSGERDKIMADFAKGDIKLLVSTTVIEVGIDVPTATVMMIEGAERFGLSQLHQLRGRIGRGSKKSHCILVSDSKSKESRERLNVMKATHSGFDIAREDLKQRGAGEFFGSRQHGLPKFKIADLASDPELMEMAAASAAQLTSDDPTLTDYPELRATTDVMLRRLGADN